MTAKEYLRQIKKLEVCLEQKKSELRAIERERKYLRGVDYRADRVDKSEDGVGFTRVADRVSDLQKEIEADIRDLDMTRHNIIRTIQAVDDARCVEVLHRRYVEYQRFEKIAYEMCYSYDRICHLHGEALEKITAILQADKS